MHETDVLAADPVAERDDLRGVPPEARTGPGQDGARRPHRQHEPQQQQGQQQVDLAEPLDALVEPQDHRRQRHAGDAGDQRHLGRAGGRDAEQVGQSGRRLLGAQAEGRGQSEQRGDDGEGVDDVAEAPPHRVSQQRMEGRPQRQRQPQIARHEGESERDDREDGPRVQAPVEDGGGHAEARRVGIGPVDAERRLQEVRDGLRHSEEHQADAHPRREQHGEPGAGGVVGPRAGAAQAHAAHRRHQQHEAEEQEQVARAHEHPVERRGEPEAQGPEGRRGRRLEPQHGGDEPDGGQAGDQEDRVVDVEAEPLDVVPADFVVGLRDDRHDGPRRNPRAAPRPEGASERRGAPAGEERPPDEAWEGRITGMFPPRTAGGRGPRNGPADNAVERARRRPQRRGAFSPPADTPRPRGGSRGSRKTAGAFPGRAPRSRPSRMVIGGQRITSAARGPGPACAGAQAGPSWRSDTDDSGGAAPMTDHHAASAGDAARRPPGLP